MSVSGVDPIIHAPARLQIVAFLAGVEDAEFSVLREMADVSDSVLSKHLSQLQDAGYVSARKAASGGRQRTWLSLTSSGRRAFAAYVKTLEALARIARRNAE